jgi:hypothetical protein
MAPERKPVFYAISHPFMELLMSGKVSFGLYTCLFNPSPEAPYTGLVAVSEGEVYIVTTKREPE